MSDLTLSTPAQLTAYAGLDALCQAIESGWNRSANDISMEYSLEALDIIFPNIVAAVGGDKDARRKMAKGAYLAEKLSILQRPLLPMLILIISHLSMDWHMDIQWPCLWFIS